MTRSGTDFELAVERARWRAGPIWNRAVVALKMAQVRLRLPIVLVVAALVVGRWETIRNYWDRLTRPHLSESIASPGISADTEYFCPMYPIGRDGAESAI
jgi:hypothetical protein